MKVVALVPAYNEAARVATTVHALLTVDAIDEVVVIDDGSTDETASIAAQAGARVERLERNLGKGGALRAGLARIEADLVVLIDADLQHAASVAGPLLGPVMAGEADMTIAQPPEGAPSGFGLVERFSRWGIRRLAGVEMARPLSGQRAMKREIADRFGFANGFGVEAALTIDAVRAGYRVLEVSYPIEHARTGRDVAGFAHRARQGGAVARVLASRAFRGARPDRDRQSR